MGNATNRLRITRNSSGDDGFVREVWGARVSEPRRPRDTIAPDVTGSGPVAQHRECLVSPRVYPRGTQPPDAVEADHENIVSQAVAGLQPKNATNATVDDVASQPIVGDTADVDADDDRKRGRGLPANPEWIGAVRLAIQRRGWDGKVLAEKIGYNKTTTSRLLNGVYTDLVAWKVSQVLDIDLPEEMSQVRSITPTSTTATTTPPPTGPTGQTESFALQQWINVGQRLLSRSGSTFNRVLRIAEKYLAIEDEVAVKLELHQREVQSSDR